MEKMVVFIGSSSEKVEIMKQIAVLLENIDFIVKCWVDNESFILGRTVTENITNVLDKVDAAVFIYSEDDKTWYRDVLSNSPRDNVIFEYGLFAGRLGLNRSIIIRIGETRIPTDLVGITYAQFEEHKLNTLENQLRLWKKEIERLDCRPANSLKTIDTKPKIVGNKNTSTQSIIEIVEIPKGFYRRVGDNREIKLDSKLSISKKLVTQTAYQSIMKDNPSYFKGDFLPVESISFMEAIKFCNKLSINNGYQEVYTIANGDVIRNDSAIGYRLPFENEWDCALGYSNTEIISNLSELAWFRENSENRTHEIRQKRENLYGVFDMLGNVWEWCFDCRDDGMLRVLRGGSFADFRAQFVTQGFRKEKNQCLKSKDVGIRIVFQDNNK